MDLLATQSCYILANQRILHAVSNPRTMLLIRYISQVQCQFGAIQLLKSECQRVGISH